MRYVAHPPKPAGPRPEPKNLVPPDDSPPSMTTKLIAAIDAVEAELAKGTPGPWEMDTEYPDCTVVCGPLGSGLTLTVNNDKPHDARNIAAWMNAAPGVLQAARERCEKVAEYMQRPSYRQSKRDTAYCNGALDATRADLAPIFAQYADLKEVRDLEVDSE